MAANFIEIDPVKGARILQALRAIREGRNILGQERLAFIQKIDGDTGTAANYTVATAKLGFVANGYSTANDAALAGFAQIDSLFQKLNATTGDATGAAIDQACAEFGV